jgi:hypothetical protein
VGYRKNEHSILVENPKERGHLGDININGRIY